MTNQARAHGLQREERDALSSRSGERTPSSGGEEDLAGPPVAPRVYDDWGAEDIYRYVHDGLEPDELDIEVEFEDRWTWTDVAIVVLATVIAVSWFAGLAGWLN